MARFKGKAPTRQDLFVPVVAAAILVIVVIFLIWFFVDRNGLMLYWNNLSASLHR